MAKVERKCGGSATVRAGPLRPLWLLPPVGLWDSDGRAGSPLYMRLVPPTVRLLAKGSTLVALSLLLVTVFPAAAAARDHGLRGQVCDAYSTFRHHAHRRTIAPISAALPVTAAADHGARLDAGAERGGDDDAAVIQDDAPAASVDVAERLTPPLEPVGTLTAWQCRVPADCPFSPRSPRGPPYR